MEETNVEEFERLLAHEQALHSGTDPLERSASYYIVYIGWDGRGIFQPPPPFTLETVHRHVKRAWNSVTTIRGVC